MKRQRKGKRNKNILKKSITRILLSLLFTGSITACEEHTDIYDNSLRVGNILLTTAEVVTPQQYDAEKHQAVGVIFYAKRDTALVVALRESGRYSYSEEMVEIKGAGSSMETIDGLQSTAALIMADYETPAAEMATKYSAPMTGWYLPSAYELRLLAMAKNHVEKSLERIGGQLFETEQYVSSSQDGSSADNRAAYCYCVSLQNGFVTSSPKTVPLNVRAVMMIH